MKKIVQKKYLLRKRSVQAGFTLIEVLVALLILSIGVMGMIAMESKVLKDNQSAYYRSQATILIYDMADKMRSNMEVDYSSVSSSSSANACVFYSVATVVADCSNADEVAKKQKYDWETEVSATLPMGAGVITASGSVATVRVTWDDDRDGDADAADPAESFSMSFEL